MATTLSTTLALTKEGIDWVVNQVPPNRERQYEPLFNSKKTRSKNFEAKTVTGFGFPTQTAEGVTITYDTRKILFNPTFVPLKYVAAFKHSVEAEYQDIYGEIMKDAALARDALFEGREKNLQQLYVDGFTGTSGPDSLAFYHTTHTTNGNATYRNRPDTDISLDSLSIGQGRSEMRKVKDPRNMARKVRGPVILWVPPDLEHTAETIVNSSLTPENANTAANVARKGLRVLVLDYQTDVNNWGLQMQDKDRHSVFYVDRMPITTKIQPDIDVLADKFAVFEEYVIGWLHGYGTWGTAPA